MGKFEYCFVLELTYEIRLTHRTTINLKKLEMFQGAMSLKNCSRDELILFYCKLKLSKVHRSFNIFYLINISGEEISTYILQCIVL